MVLTIILFILTLAFLLGIWIYKTTCGLILGLDDLKSYKYGLVLGAGLKKDGEPTDILSDRVLSAISLIKTGKVKKLIMSGSSNAYGYGEARAMEKLALSTGIKPDKLEIDQNGISTFDSLKNYKNHFGPDDLIIITQQFHLYRSLWLAKLMRLNGYGFAADLYRFSTWKTIYWYLIELFAAPFNLLKFIGYFYKNKN
jgi:SanA protein